MRGIYRFIAWVALVLVALTGVLRATALRWWQLPTDDLELGTSLQPTLEAGDWILLWNLTPPGRGDLVLCPDPDDPTNVVMGRIAALSGDTVELRGQQVVIDGKAPPFEYNCTERTFTFTDPDTKKEVEGTCDMEELGEKLHKRGLVGSDTRQHRLFKKQVPQGQLFLLSDNRAAPFDSRHIGTVDRATCHETVFFRLVSRRGFRDVDRRLTFIR